TTPFRPSGAVTWLYGKPNQLAVGDEQRWRKEEHQDSQHGPILRTAKMRGHGSSHVERGADRCEWCEHRQRRQEQRDDKADTTAHFNDANQAKVFWLKILRPTYAGQIDIGGVWEGELEQPTHGEEESK